MFCKKCVYKNFEKFQNSSGRVSFNEACNFIKKRPLHRCFTINFAIFLRKPSDIADLHKLRARLRPCVQRARKWVFFFNCYLVAPRPTLGHSQRDSLTNPMLITAFYLCRPEGHWEPRNEVGFLSYSILYVLQIGNVILQCVNRS